MFVKRNFTKTMHRGRGGPFADSVSAVSGGGSGPMATDRPPCHPCDAPLDPLGSRVEPWCSPPSVTDRFDRKCLGQKPIQVLLHLFTRALLDIEHVTAFVVGELDIIANCRI